MGQAIRGAVVLVAVAACLVAFSDQGLAQDAALNQQITTAEIWISILNNYAREAREAAARGVCWLVEDDAEVVDKIASIPSPKGFA
jgi:hypothetical protein